jgi:hypothetical protein
MTAIEANGQLISFGRGDKPRIQNTAGQNVVAAIDRALTQVSLSGGSSRAYEFGVDEKLNPTFKAAERLLAWNPATKLALSDSGWTYQITPDPDGGYAAINRKNTQGQTEFWHNNRNKGVEITRTLDGARTVINRFVNGTLAGKVRKKEIFTPDGKTARTTNTSYDERGQLIRILDEGNDWTKTTTFVSVPDSHKKNVEIALEDRKTLIKSLKNTASDTEIYYVLQK